MNNIRWQKIQEVIINITIDIPEILAVAALAAERGPWQPATSSRFPYSTSDPFRVFIIIRSLFRRERLLASRCEPLGSVLA